MIWLKSLGLKVWAYVAGAALGLLLLYRIYEAGEKGAKVDSLEQTLNAVKERKDIEMDVDGISDDDVIKRLKDQGWFRDE